MKPREKLAAKGIKTLKNEELIALILKCGNRKESVYKISRRICNELGTYSLKIPKSLTEYKRHFELNNVHAGQILAAIELGKRIFTSKDTTLNQIGKIEKHLHEMKKYKKEVLRGLYVSSNLELITDEVISIGSLDKNIIHPREIFIPAITNSAYGFFLVHNHPSGEAKPSDDDIKATIAINKAAQLLQIKLLDHLIIARNGIFSFYQAGLIS